MTDVGKVAAQRAIGILQVLAQTAASHACYAEILEAYRGICRGLNSTFRSIAEKMP